MNGRDWIRRHTAGATIAPERNGAGNPAAVRIRDREDAAPAARSMRSRGRRLLQPLPLVGALLVLIALVGYWLYPTAPPRLFSEWGFTDSVSQFMTGGTGFIDYGPAKAFTNFYAAVPSMHVCFAVMIGIPMVKLAKHWWTRLIWGLYPLLITFVVVAIVFVGIIWWVVRRGSREETHQAG